jgi:hypothetical protein
MKKIAVERVREKVSECESVRVRECESERV